MTVKELYSILDKESTRDWAIKIQWRDIGWIQEHLEKLQKI